MRVLLALAAFGLFGMDARAGEAAEKFKVPFKLMPTGHFLVDVKVNGKGPYKLIFDTGAPMMLLNSRLAKDAGLPKTGGSIFAPAQLVIKELMVGPAKAADVPATVMNHPTVEAFSNAFKATEGPIDGIVGFPFFARYAMSVDYQAKELVLTPSGYKPGDIMETMTKALMSASEQGGKPKFVAVPAVWGVALDKGGKDDEPGLSVTKVTTGSAAESAGLKEGDRLLTVGGRWTDTVGDAFVAASFAKPGKPVKLVVKRGGEERAIEVTPRFGY
jgi:hypothetical protein